MDVNLLSCIHLEVLMTAIFLWSSDSCFQYNNFLFIFPWSLRCKGEWCFESFRPTKAHRNRPGEGEETCRARLVFNFKAAIGRERERDTEESIPNSPIRSQTLAAFWFPPRGSSLAYGASQPGEGDVGPCGLCPLLPFGRRYAGGSAISVYRYHPQSGSPLPYLA